MWVDDKPAEGTKIFNSISITKVSAMLVQLLSTQELKQWLKTKGQYLLKDSTAKVIFITNMSRKEGDEFNPIAGIEGLK